jgi:hypothetical protein
MTSSDDERGNHSVVLLAAWIPYELRVAEPLVDLRQVRNRSVLTADASGFLISVALYLLVPIIVEFVQIPRSAGYGFAASLVVSGLVLVPLSMPGFIVRASPRARPGAPRGSSRWCGASA